MSFLVNEPESDSNSDTTSPDQAGRDAYLVWLNKRFEAYLAYLATIKHRLPPSTYEFAVADWHYDHTKPKCPHDAWIQHVKISEDAKGETANIRRTQIELVLLGAYHDRLLKLTYLGVNSYLMKSPAENHGDWKIDEIYLSENGLVVHEIEFQSKSSIWIECKDIRFEEQLTSTPYTAVWT